MSMKSILRNGLVIVLALAFVFAGTTMVMAEGDRLIIGSGAEAPGLDPRLEMDIPAFERINMINENLVDYNTDMELVGTLATDWEYSDDGLTLTFDLREGVLFHHGREFVAEDVKYTYDWILDEDNAAPNRDQYTDIDEIEIIDDYTVVFHLSEVNGFLINNMARMPIVPHDLAEEMGEEFRNSPVGTGPYAFESWSRDDRLVLTAFEDYWGGTPNIESVEFRPIPENSARLLALEAGEIHTFYSGVVPDEVDRLEADDSVNVHRTPGTGYSYVGFNLRNEYLADRDLRLAISHMINREAIVEHVLNGVGQVGKTAISPGLPWFNDEIDHVGYDPERAATLLEEGGYLDEDFTLRIFTNENPVRMQIAEILEYELSELGLDIEVRIEEWGAFLDRVFDGEDYEMYILGWSGQMDPDRATYRQFHTDGVYNDTYFSDSRLDELVEKGTAVPGDSQESLDIYYEVQEILNREQPYAYVNYTEEVALVRPEVQGFEMHPYAANAWLNVFEMTLD